jgi:hypothetical protein
MLEEVSIDVMHMHLIDAIIAQHEHAHAMLSETMIIIMTGKRY